MIKLSKDKFNSKKNVWVSSNINSGCNSAITECVADLQPELIIEEEENI